MASNSRSGTGSPSHDLAGSRLFVKRAREIQAQEGLSGAPVNPWGGPPTSGNSTPLRENIPESPTNDGFPDLFPPSSESTPSSRRARAGTLPSRFAPSGSTGLSTLGAPPGLNSKLGRPSPSHSPFKAPSPAALEPSDPLSSSSTLLSRLRAGSMPQRSPFSTTTGTSSPFGPSVFSSWNVGGRDRASTLASIASVPSNGPSSPAQSQFSKDANGDSDVHMRTLDYLGLAETPQTQRAQLLTPYIPNLAEFAKQASRIRSYSVNNQDKYADDETDAYGSLESQYAAHLQDQINATHAAIRNHNLAVQAFTNQAALTRPRASTAGVLDAPQSRSLRPYFPTPSRLDNSMISADIMPEDNGFDGVTAGVAALGIGRSSSRGLLDPGEFGLDAPTSSLWLGSIPTSTTTSTLTEMFKKFGTITSVRVLTHKNCGFVNFEKVENAALARQTCNNTELFPGGGAIRINFAKPTSGSNTPGHDGVHPSPSPDPFAKSGQYGDQGSAGALNSQNHTNGLSEDGAPLVGPLRDLIGDILEIVKQFGTPEKDMLRIEASLVKAIDYEEYVFEIPAIREPMHTRVHDAPKLRDIRKRIDNQSLTAAEIEGLAIDMLPEIVELGSDYLGNTVVQKLFEHCSDPVRDEMLVLLAPHLAEIGVHKNGTWAAQKIIEVCKTSQQLRLIVNHLQPYTVQLFLDQYGNYVVQCCLKFGAPYTDFIFETMLSQLWQIAQGRYGARAMRACLESHHATKDQQRMLAAVIALHSVQLATNANGALLLTWLLDTCTFPLRRTVLAPQLAPHLVLLCTHKVAYLTVLKVINQKAEPEARDTILQAMFFTKNDHTLEAILSDQSSGATLVFKVLTTPFFDEKIRSQVVENVKNVLVRIKASPHTGYKRLMDEVGLNTRGAGSRDHSTHNGRQRSSSRHASGSRQQQQNNQQNSSNNNQQNQQQTAPQQTGQSQFAAIGMPNGSNPQFFNPAGFDQAAAAAALGAIPRHDGMDPSIAQQYNAFNAQSAMFNGNPTLTPLSMQQQLQFQQQAMMSRGTPQVPAFFPQLQTGFAGYHSPSPSTDQYRGSPASNQGAFAAPGYPLPMAMGPTYGYSGMSGISQNVGFVPNDNRRQARQGRNQQPRNSSNSRQH